jgi:predicted PurR-regulated permease PerM
MKEQRIQARWLALLIATAIALYLCWLMLVPFVNVLAWASVLVIIFYPIHRRLVNWTRRPATSALLSSLLVIFTIVVPLTLITLAVINELSNVVQAVQGNVSTLLDPQASPLGRAIGWLGQYINIEQLRSPEFLLERLRAASGAIASGTLGFVGGIVGAVVQIFFVIFTMYYLFRDGERFVVPCPKRCRSK